MTITLKELTTQSSLRVKRWHGEEDWNLLEWAGAMAGEAGECCNAAKKLRRIEQGMFNLKHGTALTDPLPLRRQVAHEAADTILYAVLVIEKAGIDLEALLQHVFNAKSKEYGFPERLGDQGLEANELAEIRKDPPMKPDETPAATVPTVSPSAKARFLAVIRARLASHPKPPSEPGRRPHSEPQGF